MGDSQPPGRPEFVSRVGTFFVLVGIGMMVFFMLGGALRSAALMLDRASELTSPEQPPGLVADDRSADWSPDGTKALIVNYVSVNESYVHVYDLKTGGKVQVPVPGGGKAAHDAIRFAGNDEIFLSSDAEGEFRQLARVDLKESLDRANYDLSRIGALAASARRTTEMLGDASEVLLDPTFPDSLQNRTIGMLQATEKAARTFAAEAPATAMAIRESSENVAVVTERFAKPVPWWSRTISAAIAAVTGYKIVARGKF